MVSGAGVKRGPCTVEERGRGARAGLEDGVHIHQPGRQEGLAAFFHNGITRSR